MFSHRARQGVLKVTGHGAKRSGRTGMIHNIIESRRDDSVVQDITSTTEASLRDAESIGQPLSVHSASLHTRLEVVRPTDSDTGTITWEGLLIRLSGIRIERARKVRRKNVGRGLCGLRNCKYLCIKIKNCKNHIPRFHEKNTA